ncbi:hypothetical protein [Cognatilysobacter bugurensis]|uniref:Uncharacterized protein n=1 Tax=Cognatilysobacter bugurensis TaxID=543356 RepID=A0A918T0B9_9GAMM|nr:hypothetical protein [Lysobacter bugurensis]GHA82412.1 hypothetical protein GCM10007067_20470 [Lysobacter bugurensis]
MPNEALHLGPASQLRYELVREGEARMHMRLPEDVESYLVFVLHRHQGDAQLGGRTMALECLHGLECVGTARCDALRDVGDRCLLIAGLFPALARRRNVGPDYYASLGQAAYPEVAVLARAGQASLFVQLAHGFVAMRHVLAGVAAQVRTCGSPSSRAALLESGPSAGH